MTETVVSWARAGVRAWRRFGYRLARAMGLAEPARAAAAYWDNMHCGSGLRQELLSWWAVPGMQERWNLMISGDPGRDYFQYVAEQHLAVRSPKHALTLGCGTGHREREWAKHYLFERHDGVDISAKSIEEADNQAKQAGLMQCRYWLADLDSFSLEPASYDVIFAEQSLHHVTQLEHLLRQVKAALRPEGLFIVNEFVGPSRFQWTDRQLEVTNGVLALLPSAYRHSRLNPGTQKTRVVRPAVEDMLRTDPSEAARSSEIPGLLREQFRILEWKGYGGALLHLLFENITGNFQGGSERDARLINMCFEIEDSLMSIGDLPSDFVVAVCT